VSNQSRSRNGGSKEKKQLKSMTTKPVPTKPPRSSARNANQQKTPPSHELIAQKAYEKWVSEGQQPGCDQKYWFEAEAQLRLR